MVSRICGSPPFPARRLPCLTGPFGRTALDPHPCRTTAVVGEGADAVGASEDFVEAVGQFCEGNIRVDVLGDIEGGFHGQRQPRDDAECAQSDDHSWEAVRVALPAHFGQFTVGADEFERSHSRSEAFLGIAGAMRGRRDAARHRNMRQRREIGQSGTGFMEDGGHFSVAKAGADGHGGALRVLRVHFDQPRQTLQPHQVAAGIGDSVEGVAAAQRPYTGRRSDDVLQLLDRSGAMDALGTEDGVSGPVLYRCARCEHAPSREFLGAWFTGRL